MALIFSDIQKMMQFLFTSQILVWLDEIMCTELLQMNFTFIFVCTMLKLNILWDAIMLLILIFDSVCRNEIVNNFVSIFISLVEIARKSFLKYSLTIAFSEILWFHRKKWTFRHENMICEKSCKILPFWQIPFETFCPISPELLIVQKSTFYPQIPMDLTYWTHYSTYLYLQPFSQNFRKTECHFFYPVFTTYNAIYLDQK